MNSSGLREQLGSRAPASPAGPRCAGLPRQRVFATKPRGWSPSRGRAWRRRGERACPSAAGPGERGGGADLAPTQPAAPSIPASQRGSSRDSRVLWWPCSTSCSVPRPPASRTTGSITAPSPTRAGSPGGRGCRCPSETPLCHGRAPACPHLYVPLWHRGGQPGQSQRLPAEPQSFPAPNRSPERAGPGVPGEASCSPDTAVQGRARPGATFHASSLLAWTLPCSLGEASPRFPVSPAARFGCGFLPVRFRSRAVQENSSLPR